MAKTKKTEEQIIVETPITTANIINTPVETVEEVVTDVSVETVEEVVTDTFTDTEEEMITETEEVATDTFTDTEEVTTEPEKITEPEEEKIEEPEEEKTEEDEEEKLTQKEIELFCRYSGLNIGIAEPMIKSNPKKAAFYLPGGAGVSKEANDLRVKLLSL